jgi:hypothetical protein
MRALAPGGNLSLPLTSVYEASSKRMSWRAERQTPVAGAEKLRIRRYTCQQKGYSGAEWSHPLFFDSRNKRWLDFARHDRLSLFRDLPIGEPAGCPRFRAALFGVPGEPCSLG